MSNLKVITMPRQVEPEQDRHTDTYAAEEVAHELADNVKPSIR
jgi:hypothetical protein